MKNATKTALLAILLLAASSIMVGCSNTEDVPLSTWMQQERESIRPSVTPVPEPKTFEPHTYNSDQLIEPFSNERLVAILKSGQTASQNSALIDAELARRKQPLEAFPLDTMSMVGSMKRAGGLVALIKIGSLLYQVSPGNYIGQNFGRIEKIVENELTLREIAQDAAGEWIERPAALQLQEDTSK